MLPRHYGGPLHSMHDTHRGSKIGIVVGAILGSLSLVGIIILLVVLLKPRQARVEVEAFGWEYNIGIAELCTNVYSDWYLPVGARLLYVTDEVYDYEEVVVGYDCYEVWDDYYEEYVEYTEPVVDYAPIYEPYYTYELDEWRTTRYVTTMGTDKSPYWGTSKLSPGEKEHEYWEYYSVTVRDVDTSDVSTYDISHSDWLAMQLGETYDVSITVGGHLSLNNQKK